MTSMTANSSIHAMALFVQRARVKYHRIGKIRVILAACCLSLVIVQFGLLEILSSFDGESANRVALLERRKRAFCHHQDCVGILHRNCDFLYKDNVGVYFDFYQNYQMEWHNTWWSATELHPVVLQVYSSQSSSSSLQWHNGRHYDEYQSRMQTNQYGPAITFVIVCGVHHDDGHDDTFDEVKTLLNSILLHTSVSVELVLLTNEAGSILLQKMFSVLSETRFHVAVVIQLVEEEWIRSMAQGMNYNITHHSGVWGTLKLFVHHLPIFIKRRDPIVIIDTDMIFMTDPAGLLPQFPSKHDSWLYRMPLQDEDEEQKPSGMCSCIVIMNLVQLQKNDPYPDQFVNALALQQERYKQKPDSLWGSPEDGMLQSPHGDQGVYWALLQTKPRVPLIVRMPQPWNIDRCHGFYEYRYFNATPIKRQVTR